MVHIYYLGLLHITYPTLDIQASEVLVTRTWPSSRAGGEFESPVGFRCGFGEVGKLDS